MATQYPTSIDSATQLFTAVNGISTTLNGALNISDVAINVIDTTNFPSVGYFVVDSEVISYTGKSASQFTGCTRAADGSTAAIHSSGTVAYANMVADHHNALMNALIAIENALGVIGADLVKTGAGKGLVVTSPDGLHTYRIAVDNNGELTVVRLT